MSASHLRVKRSRTIAKVGTVATGCVTFWLCCFAVFAACFAVPFTAGPANAQSDVFTISDVAVDVTARTTTEARTEGLQRGQVEALSRLFKRLVPLRYQANIPSLSEQDIIDLVQDFSVANEKTTARRYIATILVRFKPDSVRTVLRTNSVPFAETVSKPIVVVPLYQESIVSEPVIWSENPWLDAWSQVPQLEGLAPLQLPYGDLEDLTGLRPEDVVARDTDRLATWAARYDADNAVIAKASLIGTLGAESVRVSLYFSRSGAERQFDIAASGGQTWSELFKAAAIRASVLIEDEWKLDTMLQFDVTGQITALVPLNRLEDWLTVRERLERVPSIDRYDLQAITRDRAQVTLYYLGDENQLKLAMTQSDLRFLWQDGAWVIEDRSAVLDTLQTICALPASPLTPVPVGGSTGLVNEGQVISAPPEPYPSGLFSNSHPPRSP